MAEREGVVSNLNKLLNRCKCGVYLTVNEHKNYYEDVKDHLDNLGGGSDAKIVEQIIKQDNIVELQFYPNTPIGSYTILHYDVDKAIEQALQILDDEKAVSDA